MATRKSGGRKKSSYSPSRTRKTAPTAPANKRGTVSKSSSRRPAKKRVNENDEMVIPVELIRLLMALVFVVINFCMFEIIGGSIGPFIKSLFLGLFGLTGYLIPVIALVYIIYKLIRSESSFKTYKVVCFWMLLVCIGIFFSHISGTNISTLIQSDNLVNDLYTEKSGGGIVFGLISCGMYKLIGNFGTLFFIIILALICLCLMLDKSPLSFIADFRDRQPDYDDESYDDDEEEYYEDRRALAIERQERREYEREQRRLERERRREEIEDRKEKERERERQKEERLDDLRILNNSRPKNDKLLLNGIDLNVPLLEQRKITSKDEIHEITISVSDSEAAFNEKPDSNDDNFVTPVSKDSINLDSITNVASKESQTDYSSDEPNNTIEADNSFDNLEIKYSDEPESVSENIENDIVNDIEEVPVVIPPSKVIDSDMDILLNDMPDPVTERTHKANELNDESKEDNKELADEIQAPKPKKVKKAYKTPDISLLTKNKKSNSGNSDKELKENAALLQSTLNTFGVKVEVIGISQGPSVTRYELKPEPGTKVSKINGLADDIKLSLAAEDVRIEAPIPGKAAVGIELPNKEASAVLIRDLLESKEFKDSSSKLTFAVGKDISGQTIVADIAKMPHMLIAGSTGAGKSVCINTLIMSLLYKSDPEEVKLIMIDPKVVELSVYNGIPHLLLPVVTDPRKASAALKWAVDEMTKRYNAFAAFEVRDLKGYNAQVEDENRKGNLEAKKMPQIVVIVDELADLMMVASKEVEESICRLAQLARAAGIHLIIATQRPSVDVITGLIKANMPSRVAFRVSSGVDSRTILDMVGAERLLGKGDMLFYPQGYSKPLRVQGAFVSDNEVTNVVNFLKENAGDDVYDEEISNQISGITEGKAASSDGGSNDNDYDQLFKEACRLVVDKEKASSGMLQRVYKIGFNRAARIIDQMEEAGVVGQEEGTKPRKVLVNKDELEILLENY